MCLSSGYISVFSLGNINLRLKKFFFTVVSAYLSKVNYKWTHVIDYS